MPDEEPTLRDLTTAMLFKLFSNTTTSTNIKANEDWTDPPLDEEPPSGGVREPKRPLLPFLPGNATAEREEEFDLCICAHE